MDSNMINTLLRMTQDLNMSDNDRRTAMYIVQRRAMTTHPEDYNHTLDALGQGLIDKYRAASTTETEE